MSEEHPEPIGRSNTAAPCGLPEPDILPPVRVGPGRASCRIL